MALPDTERQSGVRFDVRGSLTLGVGALCVLAAISQGREWGWTSASTLSVLVVGVLSLALFGRIERVVAQPLVMMRWFRTRNVSLPVLSQFLCNFTYMGSFILVPQLMTLWPGDALNRVQHADHRPADHLRRDRPDRRAAGHPHWRTPRRRGRVADRRRLDADLVSRRPRRPAPADRGRLGRERSRSGADVTVDDLVDHECRDVGVAGAMQQLALQMGAVNLTVLTTMALSGWPRQRPVPRGDLLGRHRRGAGGRRGCHAGALHAPSRGGAAQSVIATISWAIAVDSASVGAACCRAIIFIRSPWDSSCPPRNACITAAWSLDEQGLGILPSRW